MARAPSAAFRDRVDRLARPRPLGHGAGCPHRKRFSLLRRVVRALTCALLLSALAWPVLGHAELEGATPGPGDEVTGSPTVLVARFSQDLDPGRTSLEVRDSSGARVARGGELGDGPREFRLGLPELAPGQYEVRWTSFSTEDGELFRDTYTFEVLAAPSPSPTPSATPDERPSASLSPSPPPSSAPPASPSPSPGLSAPGEATSDLDASVLLPIVVALAAVGAFGLWALRRPRP